MERLTTGRLASLASVNIETIRYYERRGLLSVPPRSARGYRSYPQEAIGVVRFIKGAQAPGFSLKEVAELQAAGLGECRGGVCREVRGLKTSSFFTNVYFALQALKGCRAVSFVGLYQ